MLRVYACITQEHDLRLVLVAGVICLLSSYIAFAAFDQARLGLYFPLLKGWREWSVEAAAQETA